MAFYFSQLKLLHDDMKKKDEPHAVFTVKFLGKSFSCIFITDTNPYLLYIDSFGISPFTLEFSLSDKYETSLSIENSKYSALCAYLELKWDPDNRFYPINFLEHINKNTPSSF